MAERVACIHCDESIPADSATCPVCEHRLPTKDEVHAEEKREIRRVGWRMAFFSGSEFAVGLFVVGGFYSQFMGALFFRMSATLGSGALLLGAGLICLGITIGVKMKNRDWKWGLLGFLSVAGCVVALCLRSGCETCRGLR